MTSISKMAIATMLLGLLALWVTKWFAPRKGSQEELQREVAKIKHQRELQRTVTSIKLQRELQKRLAGITQYELQSGSGKPQVPRVPRQVPHNVHAQRRPSSSQRRVPDSQRRARAGRIIPWTRTTPGDRSQRTFATDVNSDASWEPFNVSPFSNMNIFKQKYAVTMHNTNDCALDTPIRALASKSGGEDWSYQNFRDLQRQVRRLREIVGSTPSAGQGNDFCKTCHPEILKRFHQKRIGVVVMRYDGSRIEQRNGNYGVNLYVPKFKDQPVDCYFMWGSTAALSDALALRVNKDSYKVLLSRDEMASIYERAYPQRDVAKNIMLEEIRRGRRLSQPEKFRIMGV